ncbi:MAG: tRNA uridine-5-carboxymethylaminomethyl(34) synthesis GTPase MnmE [Candidatus Omnitrophica bacterium]|nr:tRNA uridine-5-carboxymethylaminomethyl(34) synthesis GTPase MnmE [Candidatus Omnitrophota bacterium]MBU1869780.1 tRNA uridine-5-carboxymethylaminomethyl(34) synthesis GTPase MnmE [Candidatus Omnitrophota bacterium]
MIQVSLDDTIAAIATSAGEGGIGIVRISGKEALAIADKIFFGKDGRKPSSFKTFTTHYGVIKNELREGAGGNIVDEVILTVMRAPRSYTKEDVVEINCHGGIVALRAVLELTLANGARLAEPGEFTKRAFLNGRIDLAQAEGVLDVIRAKTDSALQLGVEQLKGVLSREINQIRGALLDILALLEANIDFPEENTSKLDWQGTKSKLSRANAQFKGLLEGSKAARIFREGIHVVICGKPNVGKSSLLNALLKKERSIVTPVAGTTRDTIEEIIDIKGIPVRIVDTAGILEPRDLVEKKAVARSKIQIDLADLVIILFDASKRLAKEDILLVNKLRKKHTIAVINKIDLKQKIEKARLEKKFKRIIGISAKKLTNISLLEDAIVELVCAGGFKATEPTLLSNLRHIEKIRKAQILIADSLDSLDNKTSSEFIAQDIKEALGFLDDILGRRFSEDLLDKIFSEFCIGK